MINLDLLKKEPYKKSLSSSRSNNSRSKGKNQVAESQSKEFQIPFLRNLNETAKYLKRNPHLLLQKIKKYSTEDLMMRLDHERLAALETEFSKLEEGLELPHFIWLLQCAIAHPPDEKYQLVNGLIKLFYDIDINGDGGVEWSEFTQYIIDAVLSHQADQNELQKKQEDEDGEDDENQMDPELLGEKDKRKIEKAYAKIVRDYVIDPNVGEHFNLNTPVHKFEYSIGQSKFYVFERMATRIRIANLSMKLEGFIDIPKPKNEAVFDAEIGLVDNQKFVGGQNFILDFIACDQEELFAILVSNKILYFWRYQKMDSVFMQFKFDILQTELHYFESQSLWVTVSYNYVVRGWKMKTYPEKTFEENFAIAAHKDKITSIYEISALNMFYTSSLDGKIKLWDFRSKRGIADLKKSEHRPSSLGKNAKAGVVGTSYQGQFSHFIVSWGFEFVVSVWNPEQSLSRSFHGHYTGHSGVIKFCRLFVSSNKCASLDEKNNLRIWNIKSLDTMQVLNLDSCNTKLSFVYIFNNDSLLLGGKRFFYLFNEETKAKIKSLEDTYPLHISFNEYFKRFVVMTRYEIRVYDSYRGRLQEVFTDVLKQSKRNMTHLLCYVEGSRARKFYIGDNMGCVRIYNMKNAEMLKEVNQPSKEKEHVDRLSAGYRTKFRESSDVTSILFIPQENVLICGTKNSVIKIYDESNADHSQLLRVFLGAHEDSEISSLAYSPRFKMIASGSDNGIIALWDTSNGKLDALHVCHTDKVVSLEFGGGFPILIAASLDGSVSVWGHKPIEYELKNVCLYRFLVYDYVKGKRIDSLVRINSMTLRYSEDNLEFFKRSEELNQRVNIYGDKGFDDIKKETSQTEKTCSININSPTKKKRNPPKPTISRMNSREKETTNSPFKSKKILGQQSRTNSKNNIYGNSPYNSPSRRRKRQRGHIYHPEDLGVENDNYKYDTKVFDGLKSIYRNKDKMTHSQQITMEKFLEVQLENIRTSQNAKPHLYITLGCSDGNLYYFDLAPHLELIEVTPGKPRGSKEDNIRRRENLTTFKQSETLIDNQRKLSMRLQSCYDIRVSVLNFMIDAHEDEIICVNSSDEKRIVMTASKDKTVGLWSYSGEMLGKIDIHNPVKTIWDYSIDWVSVRLKEFDNVFENLELIEGKKYPKEEKDRLKNEFLIQQYVEPQLKKKLKTKKEPEHEQTNRYYTQLVARIRQLANIKKKNQAASFESEQFQLHVGKGGQGMGQFGGLDNSGFLLPTLRQQDLNDVDYKKIVPSTKFSKKILHELEKLERRKEDKIRKSIRGKTKLSSFLKSKTMRQDQKVKSKKILEVKNKNNLPITLGHHISNVNHLGGGMALKITPNNKSVRNLKLPSTRIQGDLLKSETPDIQLKNPKKYGFKTSNTQRFGPSPIRGKSGAGAKIHIENLDAPTKSGNINNLAGVIKSSWAFKKSIRKMNFDPTDFFVDDNQVLESKKRSQSLSQKDRMPENEMRNMKKLRSRKRPDDRLKQPVNNFTEKIIENHQEFMDMLTKSYTSMSQKYRIVGNNSTSKAMAGTNIKAVIKKGNHIIGNQRNLTVNDWKKKTSFVLRKTRSGAFRSVGRHRKNVTYFQLICIQLKFKQRSLDSQFQQN